MGEFWFRLRDYLCKEMCGGPYSSNQIFFDLLRELNRVIDFVSVCYFGGCVTFPTTIVKLKGIILPYIWMALWNFQRFSPF